MIWTLTVDAAVINVRKIDRTADPSTLDEIIWNINKYISRAGWELVIMERWFMASVGTVFSTYARGVRKSNGGISDPKQLPTTTRNVSWLPFTYMYTVYFVLHTFENMKQKKQFYIANLYQWPWNHIKSREIELP